MYDCGAVSNQQFVYRNTWMFDYTALRWTCSRHSLQFVCVKTAEWLKGSGNLCHRAIVLLGPSKQAGRWLADPLNIVHHSMASRATNRAL